MISEESVIRYYLYSLLYSLLILFNKETTQFVWKKCNRSLIISQFYVFVDEYSFNQELNVTSLRIIVNVFINWGCYSLFIIYFVFDLIRVGPDTKTVVASNDMILILFALFSLLAWLSKTTHGCGDFSLSTHDFS